MKALIMCGGSGTRLWPLSTSTTPKQFLRLVDPTRSMFQLTCLLAREAGASDLIVVLNDRFVSLVEEQLAEIKESIPPWRLVVEPVSRNTAPAILAGILQELDDEVITVMPSDHVWNTAAFCDVVNTAARQASEDSTIVIVGIHPTYPETGYGYIETEEVTTSGGGVPQKVTAFREKPDLETAETYLRTGRHLWNAGLFIFTVGMMKGEMERLCPDVCAIVRNALGGDGVLDKEVFEKVEDISVDYAVMEHTESCHVVAYSSSWTDIGSFRTLQDISSSDEDGNSFKGSVRQLNSKNTLVISADQSLRFNLLGVSDLIIVQSEDTREILITTPEMCQEVKKLTKLSSP